MRKLSTLWLPLLFLLWSCPPALSQQKTQTQEKTQTQQRTGTQERTLARNTAPRANPEPVTDSQKNIQEYIELLRSDVRQDKAQIMGAMMRLDIDGSAKFWPIYSEYDDELTKINDLRRDNILEYARSYTRMTDQKADELIKQALDYQKQRSDLFEKYYDRIKQTLGATTAARFAQIENQLLSIIDLQAEAALPIVGEK